MGLVKRFFINTVDRTKMECVIDGIRMDYFAMSENINAYNDWHNLEYLGRSKEYYINGRAWEEPYYNEDDTIYSENGIIPTRQNGTYYHFWKEKTETK